MAKLYKNDKNYKIIEMSHLEAANNCGFGIIENRAITKLYCDCCGKEIDRFSNLYYFCGKDFAYCKECCDTVIKTTKLTSNFKFNENYNYEKYKNLVNIENE